MWKGIRRYFIGFFISAFIFLPASVFADSTPCVVALGFVGRNLPAQLSETLQSGLQANGFVLTGHKIVKLPLSKTLALDIQFLGSKFSGKIWVLSQNAPDVLVATTTFEASILSKTGNPSLEVSWAPQWSEKLQSWKADPNWGEVVKVSLQRLIRDPKMLTLYRQMLERKSISVKRIEVIVETEPEGGRIELEEEPVEPETPANEPTYGISTSTGGSDAIPLSEEAPQGSQISDQPSKKIISVSVGFSGNGKKLRPELQRPERGKLNGSSNRPKLPRNP